MSKRSYPLSPYRSGKSSNDAQTFSTPSRLAPSETESAVSSRQPDEGRPRYSSEQSASMPIAGPLSAISMYAGSIGSSMAKYSDGIRHTQLRATQGMPMAVDAPRNRCLDLCFEKKGMERQKEKSNMSLKDKARGENPAGDFGDFVETISRHEIQQRFGKLSREIARLRLEVERGAHSRWRRIERISNSGKVLHICLSCGRTSPTLHRHCDTPLSRGLSCALDRRDGSLN